MFTSIYSKYNKIVGEEKIRLDDEVYKLQNSYNLTKAGAIQFALEKGDYLADNDENKDKIITLSDSDSDDSEDDREEEKNYRYDPRIPILDLFNIIEDYYKKYYKVACLKYLYIKPDSERCFYLIEPKEWVRAYYSPKFIKKKKLKPYNVIQYNLCAIYKNSKRFNSRF